jgi:hypothetical protein
MTDIQFRLTPYMIRFGEHPADNWSFPNLLDAGNIHVVRWLHRYETSENKNEDLTASSMVDALCYLVLECPTTKEACRILAQARAAHRQISRSRPDD